MEKRCDYCGNYYQDTYKFCPECGAPNDFVRVVNPDTPQTIEEFKQWYVRHNLPSEEITRFFIGKDYRQPKAFGIYQDPRTKNFVVYKNKLDGSRSIRYDGKDEAYAVNELFERLKAEISNQKSRIRR